MSENSQIVNTITRTAVMLNPILVATSVGTVKFICFLARMAKEKIISNKHFNDAQSFMNSCKNGYSLEVIPIENLNTTDPDKLNSIKKELDELGIRYFELEPTLFNKDGAARLVVDNIDKDKFDAWYQGLLFKNLQGGEKNIEYLQTLTMNQTSIVNLPLEGKEDLFKADFEKLGINYAVYPDLKVGDGDIQLCVSNADIPKVNKWCDMFRQSLIDSDFEELTEEEVNNLKARILSSEEYTSAATVDENTLLNQISGSAKQANEKYEAASTVPPGYDKLIATQLASKSTEDPEFVKMYNDPEFEKITFNKETTIDDSHLSMDVKHKLQSNGYTYFRVPGTWGDSEINLVLRNDKVFRDKDDVTYLGFISKNQKVMAIDAKGKMGNIDFKNVKQHFDKVENALNVNKKIDLTLGKVADKAISAGSVNLPK